MRKLILLLFMTTSCCLYGQQDSITLSFNHQKLLFDYAVTGYVMEKIDSLDSIRIKSLEDYVELQNEAINSRENQILKDGIYQDSLFSVIQNFQRKQDIDHARIDELTNERKRLRREKLEFIVVGVTAFIASLFIK